MRNEKSRKIKEVITEKNANQRIKESRLLLSMIDANSKLTVGVAIALKNGKCNGEVKEGLTAVEKANTSYKKFLEEIAIEQIKKEETEQ